MQSRNLGFVSTPKYFLLNAVAGISLAAAVLSGCMEQSIEADKPKSSTSACTSSSGTFTGGIDPGSAVTTSSATISWSALPANCSTIYRVYQLPNLSTPVAWAAAPAASTTVSNLSAGTSYQFVVRAFDGSAEDTNLKIVTVTMPAAAIGSFTINSMSTSTNHAPTFAWTAATNAQTYKLEVSHDPTFPASATVLSQSGLTATNYTVSQDLAFGKYWVKVTAQANGATDVVAANSPQTLTILPKFVGCLQAYGAKNGESTGWQSAGCSKGTGLVNNYMYLPQGIMFDSVSNYLYALDYGINRWDMNFYSSAGFVNYYTLGTSYGFQSSANTRGFITSSAGSPNAAGCADSTYIYLGGYGRVERINRTNQTWAGQIVSGSSGWTMTTATAAAVSNAWDRFGGYVTVSCNSTDSYLYISDSSNHRISRWNKAAGTPAGVWGSGVGGWTSAGTCCSANNTTSGFNNNGAIRLSAAGILYVLDSGSGRLIRLTDITTPAISGWVCNAGWGTTAVGAAGCNSSWVSHAGGVALTSDSSGNLYSSLYNLIRKFDSSGNFVNQVSSVTSSQSHPMNFNSTGLDVKSDGSLVAVADSAGARIMLFDGGLSYLGYLGAGVSGLNPSSAARPPSYGMGYYYSGFATDSATDSIYFSAFSYMPGFSDHMIRYQLSNPTAAATSNYSELIAGNASPCTTPGKNPKCSAGTTYRVASSKTANWIYQADSTNGRVVRWNKTTLAFGGWIGNNTTGWQTANTVAPSSNNCSFLTAYSVETDTNGYLYVNDVTGNRVIVWRESDGSCIGSLGGGYANLVPATTGLTSQAAVAASKYFNMTIYYYSATMAVMGDWLYVHDKNASTVQRYSLTNGDPTTLTWAGWIGNTTGGGWNTSNYAGVQGPLLSPGATSGMGGSGTMIVNNANGAVKILSMGDGSEIGRALGGPDYEFTTSGSTPVAGDATGDGKIYGTASAIYVDHYSKELFLHFEGVATLRYK